MTKNYSTLFNGMAKKIPTYEIALDGLDSPNPAVNFVALVDFPAIEKGWMMFGKQNSSSQFKFDATQKERRIITGALMITDTPIYRNTTERGEFNVIFRKEHTETILKKFAKGNNYNNINYMHESNMDLKGIYLIELFMVDKARGIKTPSLFDEAPDGSIFASYYVENDFLWNEHIMKGNLTGFSIECFMDVLFSSDKFASSDPLLAALEELKKFQVTK